MQNLVDLLLVFLLSLLARGALDAVASSQETAAIEHVIVAGIDGPEVSALATHPEWQLDEAGVEGEVVSNGVLPALLALLVVGELGGYPAQDLVQGQAALRGVDDGHADERDVAVRWFARLLGTLPLLAARGLLTLGLRGDLLVVTGGSFL